MGRAKGQGDWQSELAQYLCSFPPRQKSHRSASPRRPPSRRPRSPRRSSPEAYLRPELASSFRHFYIRIYKNKTKRKAAAEKRGIRHPLVTRHAQAKLQRGPLISGQVYVSGSNRLIRLAFSASPPARRLRRLFAFGVVAFGESSQRSSYERKIKV